MQHVFISYMHENTDVVDRLCHELTSRDIKFWLDRNDIAPGIQLEGRNSGTRFAMALFLLRVFQRNIINVIRLI